MESAQGKSRGRSFQRSVHGSKRTDWTADDFREGERQDKKEQSTEETQNDRVCTDLLEREIFSVACQKHYSVCPLQNIEQSNKRRNIKDGFISKSHLHKRDPDKSGIGKGSAEPFCCLIG